MTFTPAFFGRQGIDGRTRSPSNLGIAAGGKVDRREDAEERIVVLEAPSPSAMPDSPSLTDQIARLTAPPRPLS